MMVAASLAGYGGSIAAAVAADEIVIATITGGRLFVLGTTSESRQRVVLDGRFETTSDEARSFQFELVYHPATCIVGATIGNETREAVVSNCSQRSATADPNPATAVDGQRDRQAIVPAPPAPPEPARPQSLPVAPEAQGVAALPVPQVPEPDAVPPVAASAAPEPAFAPHAMVRAPRPPLRPSDARLKPAPAAHDERAKHRPALAAPIKLASDGVAETADRKAKPTPKPIVQRRKPVPAQPPVE
ncbi:hypothetical protein [Methylobacterium thuringiense]|uniref:hypothetical protein n=1 Tax=Methylobacterium thuringiense TaxID=1003091 RepID=UPI0011C73A1C|nr:hypothetical protein [Methylobacterium thuringiense]TXN22747.1 hypothetical protein FV217_09510 [Methylobacterium sp. WL9]